MNNKISTGKNNIVKETFAVIAVILGLIVLQWRLWVTRQLMVTHDSIIWYGIFQYFVDCLHHGFLPLWNPYMNCGEPFFLNISMLHLWDPSTLLLVLIGKFLKTDFLILYHYGLLLHYIIFICGSYLFFRYVAKYKISALIAFITISFSSFYTSYLRQHAFILAFYLLPWILLYILKFLEQRKAKFLLYTAFFLGITLPSYHSMFIVTSVVILFISLFLTKGLPKPKIKTLFQDYKLSITSFFIFLLLVLNLLPQFFLYTKAVVPTARLFEAPLAAHTLPADFINLLNPYSFLLHFFNWGYMSESFLYIGLIPILFSIIGIWFSRHKYKPGFILTTVIIMFLMLGTLYPLFCRFFPFFSIIRNTHTFGPFFLFCLAYFTCIGIDTVSEWFYTAKIKCYIKPMVYIILAICLISLLANSYLLKVYPSLIGRYNILKGYLTLNTPVLINLLRGYFLKSYSNAVLFITGTIIISLLFRNIKINKNIKYFTVVFFIFIDLFSYNSSVYKFVTMPREDLSITISSKPVYHDFRIPVIQPKYPFYAFAPAMLKIFSAYSTKIPWITTHFYEMKDFFELINNQQVSDDVKNVLMGISAPKLSLVDRVVILSHDEIIEEFKKIDTKSAEKVIFIEEDLPLEYSHLKVSLDNINSEGLKQGDIKVKSFSPNEIVIDVYTNQDSFLYYSDGFDKAWRAFINGKERKVYKSNLAFKSVIVDKGNNIVRFVYDPKFYKVTLFCYFTGLFSSITIFFFWILKKYKYMLKH